MEMALHEELSRLWERLQEWPPECHWYCSKRSDDDPVNYEDLDASGNDIEEGRLTLEEISKLVQEGRDRLRIAYRLCLVYGLSAEEAADWQERHRQRSIALLSNCDRCVKNYHMARKSFLKDVSWEYGDDLVSELSDRINQMDFLRIDKGLLQARNMLAKLPELQRTTRSLTADPTALTALYEALCSSSYHTSKEKLSSSFEDPFKLVQSRKILRLGDILPAMTRFLFDADPCRLRFAKAAWQDPGRKLTKEIFDWAVHDALTDAILSVSQSAAIPEIQRFWDGLLLVLPQLDKDLITHSLRGMEVQPGVYHLALLHLAQYDSEDILDLIIKALRVLLEKSPSDFWAAYGAISPTTIAEQVFISKSFGRLLARSHHSELVDDIEVPFALAWISPFVRSLPATHQYEVCRSLLHHLFERFQTPNLPKASALACFRAGLNALLTTLMTFVDKTYEIQASTSYIVVNNILGLVDQYRVTIVDCANLSPQTAEDKELSRVALQVIRNALALCSKSILAEFGALEFKKDIRHELPSHSRAIWQAVLDGFRRDNSEMARNILIGLQSFVGLDKLKPRGYKDEKGKWHDDPLLKSKVRFNGDFDRTVEMIALFFERLSDFTPSMLRQLCRTSITANSLLGGLTPPDQATYEAAVEVIKAITGESGRREAMAQLLLDSFRLTLSSLSWTTRQISKHETFASVPYLLKTSGDVVESLCDPQNGILRTKTFATGDDQRALMTWWTEQWSAIANIFKNYEHWASGSDLKLMTEVCRDIMEYAESLFDQYSVLASAMDGTGHAAESKSIMLEASNASRKTLLQNPSKAMEHLVKWLRLRDPYLLTTLVSLVCKILRRLGEFDMEIETDALRDVELVGKGHHSQYKVTPQQRAELLRAFEEHQGLEMIEEPVAFARTKQGTIDDWSKSANGVRHEPSMAGPRSKLSLSSMNSDVQFLSKSLEQGKSALDVMKSRQQAKTSVTLGLKGDQSSALSIKESREKAKEEKKRRDAKYLAEVRALRAPPGLVTGEGSGLKGIGVRGKDHGPASKEQGVMVSSDDESDDDDSDVKMLINQRAERSKKVLDKEQIVKRNLHQQIPQGPVKKKKIVRSANDMRARLVPNMDILHLTILKWDIFHNGDEPPNGIKFQDVSNTFQTPNSYYDTFYPLLIAEAWRSLSTAKDEQLFKPFEIKVVNRMSVDAFFEVGTSMPIAENRENNIMEGDIVLLSKGQNPLKDSREVLCLSRVYRITRKKDVVEISYRISGQASGNASLLSALSPNLTIRGLKITSMTTIEREYAALKSLEFYDLCDEILSAQPSPLLAYPDHTLNPVKGIYGVNMAQAKAIWSVRENDAFTLVQGPPGSGKTKTIVAMVGALLTEKLSTSGVAISHPRSSEPRNYNDAAMQKKLLICAPSNAAVDELVTRLKAGVKTLKGDFHKINVVRLGRSDAIDANVKDVTLDELVRAKMEGDGKAGLLVLSDREKLHQDAARLKEALNVLRPKLEEARAKKDVDLERRLQRDIDGKKRDQARIGAKIDDQKANGNSASRENEITRRRLQQEIIDSAHVLCATLSGSGHEMFKNLSVEFETVIIDEAAQCIELSAIIPLKYGCSKCVLVGDPKQLPPTVLSRSAARYGYEQSLFVRMQQNHPNDVHLLDTQYRMHPEISAFPSRQFYDGKLIDGEKLALLRKMPWHASEFLGPYRFFDVKGVQTSGVRGHSFINMEEIAVALQLYERLRNDYGSYDYRGKIGIITPYKAQLRELRTSFQRRYGDKVFDEIEFNTTDAFQGRESEIILFSCVRARAYGGIGFLSDIRRMNVGLTRAKSSLWVLGDSASLAQGEFWAKLIDDAKARNKYTHGDLANLLRLRKVPNSIVPRSNGSGSGSTDSGRRASTVSVEMLDAPDIVDSEKSSVESMENGGELGDEKFSSVGQNMAVRKRRTGYDHDEAINRSKTAATQTKATNETFPVSKNTNSKLNRPPHSGGKDPKPDVKDLLKRGRESSPEQTGTASKKLSTGPGILRPASAASKGAAASAILDGPTARGSDLTAPRRPMILGNVPPPRKKAPADPLLRSRPNAHRPR